LRLREWAAASRGGRAGPRRPRRPVGEDRDAIADALLDLLADGRPPPDRAGDRRPGPGVGPLRLCPFRRPGGSLLRRRQTALRPHRTDARPTPATGALSERAGALVRQRIRLYAQAGAVARATRLHAAFSPTLARILREAQARSRADLERLFAKELDALSPAHRTSTLAMLDVLTGPDAWETLRERYAIDDETAIRRVTDSIVLHLRAARA